MSMNVFAQITKVDVAKREVWGRAAQEVPDHSGEIMDYDTSKPLFESWSTDVQKASDGKSMGNVRSMHGNVAAGKVISMNFDDAQKAVDVGVKVVDDNEWEKVLEGVHTGFSIGGKYVKKWQDGDLTRYTAQPSEVSLVDRPCIPTATFFDIVKADGVIEKVAFKSQPEPAAVAKADPAPVIEAVKAVDELADMLNKGTITPARLVELAKVDTAAKPARPEVKGENPHLAKFAQRGDDLKKGLYTISSLADALDLLSCIQQSCQWEADYEGDSSPVPGQILVAVKQLADALVAMATEETKEMLAAITPMQAASNPDVMVLAAPSGDLVKAVVDAVKTAPLADLEKAVGDALAKAGSRNSKEDQAHLDAAHAHILAACGHLVAAGADPHPGNDKATDPPAMGPDDGNKKGDNAPDPKTEKSAPAGDLLKAATAVNSELLAKYDAQAQQIADLKATVEKLSKQPTPMPGALRAVGKGEDIVDAATAPVIKSTPGQHNPEAALELTKAVLARRL